MSSKDTVIATQPKNPVYHDFVAPMNFKSNGVAPQGLEYLLSVDQLLVKQQIELLEALTGWETKNRYKVTNSMGQQVMYVQEQSTCLMRQCCGPARALNLHITDNNNQEIMRISKEFACGCCCCISCCGSCSMELVVEAPVGNVIGYIKQEQSWWKMHVAVYDERHNLIGKIRGMCCPCVCCCCPHDLDYPVTTGDETVTMGNVAKQWTGCIKESFTDADNFSITFPLDLDAKMKALMFAAAFQVEYLQFEHQQNNNNH